MHYRDRRRRFCGSSTYGGLYFIYSRMVGVGKNILKKYTMTLYQLPLLVPLHLYLPVPPLRIQELPRHPLWTSIQLTRVRCFHHLSLPLSFPLHLHVSIPLHADYVVPTLVWN